MTVFKNVIRVGYTYIYITVVTGTFLVTGSVYLHLKFTTRAPVNAQMCVPYTLELKRTH